MRLIRSLPFGSIVGLLVGIAGLTLIITKSIGTLEVFSELIEAQQWFGLIFLGYSYVGFIVLVVAIVALAGLQIYNWFMQRGSK
jgi:hypothetical protein